MVTPADGDGPPGDGRYGDGLAVHDPRFDAERLDTLALLALGESASASFETHRIGCARCQNDLAAFTRTVGLGRETSAHREQLDAQPPASVWSGIYAQVHETGSADTRARTIHSGLDRTELDAHPTHRPVPARRRSAIGAHRPRTSVRVRLGLAAAAVVLAAVGVTGGYLAGHSAGSAPHRLAADARLTSLPGGPGQMSGAAALRSAGDGKQLTVTTTGLPLRTGFYEVWLYNPDLGVGGDMVAVGALGDRGRGTFTLPSGIDIRAYHVVNISTQSYGGGSTIVHGTSVLQGSLDQ